VRREKSKNYVIPRSQSWRLLPFGLEAGPVAGELNYKLIENDRAKQYNKFAIQIPKSEITPIN